MTTPRLTQQFFDVNFTSPDTSKFKCFHFILWIFNRTFHNFPRPSVMHHFRRKQEDFIQAENFQTKGEKDWNSPLCCVEIKDALLLGYDY